MSSDLLALHRYLRRALRMSPALLLTLPLACTVGGGSSKSAKHEAKRDTTKPDAKPDEASTAIAPEEPNFPPCPSGEWCGPQALVEPLRRPDEELGTKIPDVEGCPGAIAGKDDLDEATRAKYGDLPTHSSMLANVDAEATKAKRSAGEADACCYEWMEMCPGGRPLLDDGGQPVLASVREDAERSKAGACGLAPELGEALAQAWLDDARMEHSSIASFLRARAELAAVGAPPELLDACEAAALDERRHAARCFELAARYGRPCAPNELPRLPARGGNLARVAVDTFIEGCVGETIAAACARRAARGCADSRVARALAEIAEDESEHAALAWRTVAWAVARGGQPVLHAVHAAASQLRPRAPVPPAEPLAGALAAHGRLDRRARAEVRGAAWATIIDPLLAELHPGASAERRA